MTDGGLEQQLGCEVGSSRQSAEQAVPLTLGGSMACSAICFCSSWGCRYNRRNRRRPCTPNRCRITASVSCTATLLTAQVAPHEPAVPAANSSMPTPGHDARMQAAVEGTSTITTGTAHNHRCVLHHPMASSSYAWRVQCCKDVILDRSCSVSPANACGG